jgi:hypothetical protein
LIDFFTGQGGRYGSRESALQSANDGLETARAGRGGIASRLYNRLSLGDSSAEERTAVESGSNSNDSLEMAHVKANKRSAPPSYDTDVPNHVLFNQDDNEGADPFDD